MEIEILDFYPVNKIEETGIVGNLRVKLPDVGIQLLGILVTRRKSTWHFILPSKRGTHHETKKTVQYPLIVFDDKDKQTDLVTSIKAAGIPFIEAYLKDRIGSKALSPALPEKQASNPVKTVQARSVSKFAKR